MTVYRLTPLTSPGHFVNVQMIEIGGKSPLPVNLIGPSGDHSESMSVETLIFQDFGNPKPSEKCPATVRRRDLRIGKGTLTQIFTIGSMPADINFEVFFVSLQLT